MENRAFQGEGMHNAEVYREGRTHFKKCPKECPMLNILLSYTYRELTPFLYLPPGERTFQDMNKRRKAHLSYIENRDLTDRTHEGHFCDFVGHFAQGHHARITLGQCTKSVLTQKSSC